MKNVILALMFVLILPLSIILSGCSLGGSALKPVKLGEAIPIMKDFEGISTLDGIQKNITYSEVGVSQYDQIFKDVAILNAKVTQYNFLVSKYGTNPQELLKEVAIAKISSSVFKNSTAELLLMQESIPGYKNKLSLLNPKNDFTGLNSSKIPDVTSNITNATSNLTSAASQIPQLIEGMTNIAKAL